MISETSKAYIAGIIDGEGSIMIRGCGHYDEVLLEVGNTDIKMVDFLKTCYGGSITTYNPKRAKRTMFSWRIWCNQAEVVLRDVSPYLITKKEQAYVALRLREIVREQNCAGKPMTEEMLTRRKRCFSVIGALKDLTLRDVLDNPEVGDNQPIEPELKR